MRNQTIVRAANTRSASSSSSAFWRSSSSSRASAFASATATAASPASQNCANYGANVLMTILGSESGFDRARY